MKKTIFTLLILVLSKNCFALNEYFIEIKNHEFKPNILNITANEKSKITISNLDNTPEEFESHDLNREKLIMGNKKVVVFLGPLKKGEYSFFGEFNPKTAQGKIIVK